MRHCLCPAFGVIRYGVPGKHAKGFEACLAKLLGETLETVSEHLYRITKALSPVYLQEANVSTGHGGHAAMHAATRSSFEKIAPFAPSCVVSVTHHTQSSFSYFSIT